MNTIINPALSEMSPFIVMEVLEKAHAMEKQGISIIHLEVGEPDFDMPQCIAEACNSAINKGITHYTHSLGSPILRETISQFYNKEYGVIVDPECIVVTSGSSPAILMALITLCKPGDEVIVSNPGYPCYRNFALACNAAPVNVTANASSEFQYNINDVRNAITDKTRAIFVNSPMNPTGTLVSDELFTQLIETGIPIISDEIYHGLVYNGQAKSILQFTNNAFVINGFSKRFAMTGLRLGYIIAPKPYVRALQILSQNLFICAPSISQEAGIAAINQASSDVEKMKIIYNERRIYMLDRLRKMGFEIQNEPQGAFYIFANACKFTCNSYQFAFDVLEHAHVGITPGVDFGSNGEGFVRFSYANSIENIVEGLNRIEKYLADRQ